MSRVVHVDMGGRSYDITVGRGVPVGVSLRFGSGARAMIVSDANVDALYGGKCERTLNGLGLAALRVAVPAGEKSKTLECASMLYSKAIEFNLDRASYIVALGGGVVGDLAGFVASTFLRGIALVQAPTSLLAMVDSSVGGKTAINLPQGKNLVGTFYQPVEVVADLATLESLPHREYVSGLAEVVKYGVVRDAGLFEFCEKNAGGLLNRDDELLAEVIARCCRIKAEIVAEDERENGLRAVLNFGHTLAHAIEKVCGFGTWLHGEAVAAGMAFAARLSVLEKAMPEGECDRLISLLVRFGLPVVVEHVEWEPVRQAMAVDKKTRSGIPRFVLAERIGSVAIGCEVAEHVMAGAYAANSLRGAFQNVGS